MRGELPLAMQEMYKFEFCEGDNMTLEFPNSPFAKKIEEKFKDKVVDMYDEANLRTETNFQLLI